MAITIIMPVFNGAKTIERAVNSYLELSRLSKSFNIPTNLLIIDDNSEDETHKVLTKYKLFSEIKIYKNEVNMGPGASRNRALGEVKTKYVGFLDADDELVPNNYLEVLVGGIARNADLITFNGDIRKDKKNTEKYDFFRILDNDEYLIEKCLKGELDGSVIFSIYDTKMIRDQNIAFSNNYYEDIIFAYLALIYSKKREIVNIKSYIKHYTNNSIVNTISEKHILGLLDVLINLKNIIEKDFPSTTNIEEFFCYGLRGFIAKIIVDTLNSNVSEDRKIKLLLFLKQEIVSKNILKSLKQSGKTKKDKITDLYYSAFINNSSETDYLLFKRNYSLLQNL